MSLSFFPSFSQVPSPKFFPSMASWCPQVSGPSFVGSWGNTKALALLRFSKEARAAAWRLVADGGWLLVGGVIGWLIDVIMVGYCGSWLVIDYGWLIEVWITLGIKWLMVLAGS